jgi:hypothetical protein
MAEEEKSLTWIVVAAAVFIAVVGWGILAGSYAGAHATSISDMSADELQELDTRSPTRARRGAVSAFVGNAIEQLPNLPAVISWHFSNRIWLLILIGLAMVGVVGGGFALKRVEENLSQPKHKRKR